MGTHKITQPLSEYRSCLAGWDTRSSVRNKPARLLAENDRTQLFFSTSLAPFVSHPLVVERGEACVREVLARCLYDYLDFTAILEQETVNPVVLRLTRDAYGLRLPHDMRLDAYRIYCDEAYHAYFSVEMKTQVEVRTGIRSSEVPVEPNFARTIRRIKALLPARLAGLVELCAAVVSETLISGVLSKIPADSAVAPAIRDMIADHAGDERTHHAFFTRAMGAAWPQLDITTQQALSPHFADLILAFLTPDSLAKHRLLLETGFSNEEACGILSESTPPSLILPEVRHAARSTLRLLQRTGVLDSEGVAEYFAERGIAP